MKTLTAIIAVTIGLFAATPNAEARSSCARTKVTYCGNFEIHWVYKFVGRDCHGCAIYRWVQVCRKYRPPCEHECSPYSSHSGGHGHGGFSIRIGR